MREIVLLLHECLHRTLYWILLYMHMICLLHFFLEASTSMSVLRSLWQAHWLHKNLLMPDEVFFWLEEGVVALENGFTYFLKKMEIAGWDQNQTILKVPKELVLVLEHLNQEV